MNFMFNLDPYKILKTGENEAVTGDPLISLEEEFKNVKFVTVPGVPSFTGELNNIFFIEFVDEDFNYINSMFNTGGAVGYIAYDCVKYFEPRTARELRDPLGLPDSFFLFYDTLIVFDHVYQLLKVVSHYRSDSTDPEVIDYQYRRVVEKIRRVL